MHRSCSFSPEVQNRLHKEADSWAAGGSLHYLCTCAAFIPKTFTTQVYNLMFSHQKYPIRLKVIIKHYNDDHRHIGTYSIKYVISIKNLCQTKYFNPCCRVTFSVVFVLLVVFWKPWTMPEMHNGPAKPSKSAK